MSSSREVYFELRRVGNYVKVCAFDAETLTEVSIVGDPAASVERLKQTALRKLEYVLAKNEAKK